jgi:HAD superfamily hydrolase (TIGR01509 family)
VAQLEWIFFDLGSTLIDESVPLAERIAKLSREFELAGHRVSTEEIFAALEVAWAEFSPRIVERAVEILGVEADPASLAAGKWRKDLERPYPPVSGLLESLANRYRLGVVANQSLGTAGRLESYGLLGYFDVVVASAEEGISKPDAAMFERALERAGVDAASAMMVGDRIDNDVVPAKALGLRTVRVLQGLARVQRPRSVSEEPDWTIDDIGVFAADVLQRQDD